VPGRASGVKMVGWQRWGYQLVWMGWPPSRLLVRLLVFSSLCTRKPRRWRADAIVGYHPVGAPTCLHKQEVGKPNQNAVQLCARVQGCVNDDLRADGLSKGWGFWVDSWNVDSLTCRAGNVEALMVGEVDVACIQET